MFNYEIFDGTVESAKRMRIRKNFCDEWYFVVDRAQPITDKYRINRFIPIAITVDVGEIIKTNDGIAWDVYRGELFSSLISISCFICGRNSSGNKGLAVYEDLVVPNDWDGEWGGITVCQECFDLNKDVDVPTPIKSHGEVSAVFDNDKLIGYEFIRRD